jgi:hypothetical protein
VYQLVVWVDVLAGGGVSGRLVPGAQAQVIMHKIKRGKVILINKGNGLSSVCKAGY